MEFFNYFHILSNIFIKISFIFLLRAIHSAITSGDESYH